jgi:hypothetical protein
MIFPKESQYLIIYTVRWKNVGHQPFKKVISQYTAFLCKFFSEPIKTFFLGFGVLYLKIHQPD